MSFYWNPEEEAVSSSVIDPASVYDDQGFDVTSPCQSPTAPCRSPASVYGTPTSSYGTPTSGWSTPMHSPGYVMQTPPSSQRKVTQTPPSLNRPRIEFGFVSPPRRPQRAGFQPSDLSMTRPTDTPERRKILSRTVARARPPKRRTCPDTSARSMYYDEEEGYGMPPPSRFYPDDAEYLASPTGNFGVSSDEEDLGEDFGSAERQLVFSDEEDDDCCCQTRQPPRSTFRRRPRGKCLLGPIQEETVERVERMNDGSVRRSKSVKTIERFADSQNCRKRFF